MIELLGFIYGLAKDLKDYIKYSEEEKLVDINWPEKSGFKETWENKGYVLYWSRPDKIASKQLDGWEILYEIDKIKRIRSRMVLNDGLILIGKPKS